MLELFLDCSLVCLLLWLTLLNSSSVTTNECQSKHTSERGERNMYGQ